MKPLVSAMTKVRKALAAALKSLLRSKDMLIKAILAALWPKPSERERELCASPSPSSSSSAPPNGQGPARRQRKQQKQTVEAFLKEAESLLGAVDNTEALRLLASKLKAQFREGMQSNPACMLPSYNSQLPTGYESGQYLSLDVGGSTLRVALVELKGRKKKEDGRREVEGRQGEMGEGEGEEDEKEEEEEVSSRIVRMRSFQVTPEIKALEGLAFFDWLAKRTFETIQDDIPLDHSLGSPISMGLAWSFPLHQTCLKSGLLQPMGKGFLASSGLVNQDLGDIISCACRKLGLSVDLGAIVNDSSAALLSQAFLTPAATPFGLILGTGFNMAVHVPCSSIGREKFGNRPAKWSEKGSRVVINTEMGMFGHGVLPMVRWDDRLNDGHPKPHFQPLEHLVSGMYLGEVARIALMEAIESTGLLHGTIPKGLDKEYGFGTETMSFIESDLSPSLESATAHFNTMHPSSVPATTADMLAIRKLCSYISRRSAAIVAACLYALWDVRREAEVAVSSSSATSSSSLSSQGPAPKPQNGSSALVDPISHLSSSLPSSSPIPSPAAATVTTAAASNSSGRASARAVVAYNGAVIERYPSYLETCQSFLDALVNSSSSSSSSSSSTSRSSSGRAAVIIQLVEAKESSLLGAAVALASSSA